MLDSNVVVDVVLYKKRVDEKCIGDVCCAFKSICRDNVVEYLVSRAFTGAPPEVKAAGFTVLKDALRRGVLHHEDKTVARRTKEVFSDVDKAINAAEHIYRAYELLARELRRCIVCVTDIYTVFEHYVKCVEINGDGYLFAIRRQGGVIHIFSSNLADTLDEINKRLMVQYRVVADNVDLATFETLTKIYAKASCRRRNPVNKLI
jgi:hypothetical protein